jgi:hypothetical protein
VTTHPAADRLPVPDWDRPGEAWRVEGEDGWQPMEDVSCHHRGCHRRSVAARLRRGAVDYALCAPHLAEGRMWIEDGQVVSWALRP